jgi:hypothetical protein
MEIESIILLLFTFSRIDRIIGRQNLEKTLDNQLTEVMRYFIRKILYIQKNGLEDYIRSDTSYSGRFTRLVMLIKALTYHKKSLEDNFEPYIYDIVKETLRITKSLLDELPPDSSEVKFVTYANLLSVLCFEVHPNTR